MLWFGCLRRRAKPSPLPRHWCGPVGFCLFCRNGMNGGGLTRCADLPIRLVRSSRKQNFERFCNFFAIRDSFLSVQSGNGPFRGRFAACSGLNLLFGVPRQSLIAKKLQIESHYCFRGPKTALSAKLPRGTFACIANWCINEVRKTKKAC